MCKKSARVRELVGFLDVGDDIGGLPQRIRRARPQADGPVAAPAGPRHADDVELHVAALWMPRQRIGDPGPELLEGCGALCVKCLEIHVPFPSTAASPPARRCTGERPSPHSSWRAFSYT